MVKFSFILKKKEVFQSEAKNYGMGFEREAYFEDDVPEEDYEYIEKKENERF